MTAVTMKALIFWEVALCSVVDRYQHFGAVSRLPFSALNVEAAGSVVLIMKHGITKWVCLVVTL
jgi:hypothetical protein